MTCLRVLSVDWDYFFNADESYRIQYFPDGGSENLSDSVKDLIWQTKYSCSPYDKHPLATVDIKNEIDLFKKLFHNAKDIEGLIVESHKDIFPWIEGLIHKKRADSVRVINVDFHHDLFDLEPRKTYETVTCGNWGCRLIDKYRTKYIWVGPEDATPTRYKGKTYAPNFLSTITAEMVEHPEKHFDAIFLCRSDMWSPPHLDYKFSSFAQCLTRDNKKVKILGDVLVPRKIDYEAVRIKDAALLDFLLCL